MHIINNGKEHIVFVQISNEATTRSLDSCEALFRQDVVLDHNDQKAQLIVVKKDDPSVIISNRVSIEIRPADRAFIHTADANFVQGQEILVGMIYDQEAKEVELFLCQVMDIVPNGYLR